ncbi:hypothetical protein GGP41_007041 [Bipolaris sorokiniana]|uniref:Uncharacterized protein n=1 Tax=Cochliobolus sativus TaxID=45130 RepID=A0A8H5ZTY4_COCSA|nr:hypothetical protein GGP41_007041 [Bipolaris sorokiniana]
MFLVLQQRHAQPYRVPAHSTHGLSSLYDADVMAAPSPPAKPHRLTPSRGLRKEPSPHLLLV